MSQPPAPIIEYRKSPEGIREIAKRQRAILLCILINIFLYAGAMVFQQPSLSISLLTRQLLAVAILVGLLATSITSVVFVFLLTTKLYGVVVGILLGFLTLIPCAGLITLLIVNAKATSILKEAGLKVGLLGAKVPDSF